MASRGNITLVFMVSAAAASAVVLLNSGCAMPVGDSCATVDCPSNEECVAGQCEPKPIPVAPRGTACGSFVIACYDEFARTPLNLICFRPTSRWGKTHLTWRLGNLLPGINEDDQRDALARALETWAEVSNLSFSPAADGVPADLNISFEGGDHGDPFPFDGAGGILGHAYFPGSPRPGDVHLSDAEYWFLFPDEGEFDLYTVMLHETGHALGLEHSLEQSDVMAPTYHAEGQTVLTAGDVEAIQRLYGSPNGEIPPEPVRDPVDFCEPGMLLADDPDSDGDGIPDTVEVFVLGTNPLSADTDEDGVDDFTEVFIDGTPPDVANDFGNEDSDGDGLPDWREIYFYGTDPLSDDTDGDHIPDGNDPFPTNPRFPKNCNQNNRADSDEIASGDAADCQNNGVPDDCETAGNDVNDNGVPDECDAFPCGDGDVCTIDVIRDGACVHEPVVCEQDGVFCNGPEVCVSGTCTSAGNPCGRSEICNEASNACEPGLCDDGNPCTNDILSPGGDGCIHLSLCDDGLFCNGIEGCQGGNCFPGNPPCSPQFCDEANDTCFGP